MNCAVSCNTRNSKPDLFSLEVDEQIKPRDILVVVVVGNTVYFGEKENIAMQFKATAHQCFNGEPAAHYDTFDEWPPHVITDGFLLTGGLSFTTITHLIQSRCMATYKRQLNGDSVTFEMVMRSQLESLCKEIEKKQNK